MLTGGRPFRVQTTFMTLLSMPPSDRPSISLKTTPSLPPARAGKEDLLPDTRYRCTRRRAALRVPHLGALLEAPHLRHVRLEELRERLEVVRREARQLAPLVLRQLHGSFTAASMMTKTNGAR